MFVKLGVNQFAEILVDDDVVVAVADGSTITV